MSCLHLKNIVKKFGDNLVLDNVSLELNDDELLVLLGPSGCGKSTLLRLVAGLEELDSGEIHLNDKRIDNIPSKDRQVAMVFQNYSLYPHMSVEKNLAFPLKVAGLDKNEITIRVNEIAAMLDLTDKLKSKPGQLSGGQRQRVALGRAVIRKPSIFLLDEPLSNLDAALRTRMRQEIVSLQKKMKKPLIHVTHDQAEALTMADRIVLLKEGRIAQIGTPEELYKNPNSIYTAEFIGFPKINIFNCKIENNQLTPFDIPLDNLSIKKEVAIETRRALPVGVRPEAIKLSPDGKYQATVTGCEYLGEQYIVTVKYNEIELVISGCETDYKSGETVNFDFDIDQLLLFDNNGDRTR